MNYYNEFDPHAAAWLRELIHENLIPQGHVDTQSITEVSPADLSGFAQCHFFAGIAGWPLALALARWPADRPVWTGSCPCQPFSIAGQRKGHADERHLWPAFYSLIAECRPPTVFGEQVAGGDGREWIAAVRADLEGVGYAVGAANLCAAGIGAQHIRQRLFYGAVGNTGSKNWKGSDIGLAMVSCVEKTELSLDSRSGLLQRIQNAGNSFPDFAFNGLRGPVALVRGYGNAIVPQVAATFVTAFEQGVIDMRKI